MTIRVRQKEDRLLGMIDLFDGQAGLIVFNQRNAVFPGYILRGDHDKFLPIYGRVKVDPFDPASRDAAAHGCAKEHSRQNHIVDILGFSRDFTAPFQASHRRADDASLVHREKDGALRSAGYSRPRGPPGNSPFSNIALPRRYVACTLPRSVSPR